MVGERGIRYRKDSTCKSVSVINKVTCLVKFGNSLVAFFSGSSLQQMHSNCLLGIRHWFSSACCSMDWWSVLCRNVYNYHKHHDGKQQNECKDLALDLSIEASMSCTVRISFKIDSSRCSSTSASSGYRSLHSKATLQDTKTSSSLLLQSQEV